jgi:hypothetical protein
VIEVAGTPRQTRWQERQTLRAPQKFLGLLPHLRTELLAKIVVPSPWRRTKREAVDRNRLELFRNELQEVPFESLIRLLQSDTLFLKFSRNSIRPAVNQRGTLADAGCPIACPRPE